MSMQDDTLILFKGLPQEEIDNFVEASKKEQRGLEDNIAGYFYPKCPFTENKYRALQWARKNRSCHWTKWGYEIVEPPSKMGRLKFNFALSAECSGEPYKEIEYYIEQLKGRYKELELEILVISWFEDRDECVPTIKGYSVRSKN